MIAVCSPENSMENIGKQLADSNIAVLTALRTIEQSVKARESSEANVRKTEC